MEYSCTPPELANAKAVRFQDCYDGLASGLVDVLVIIRSDVPNKINSFLFSLSNKIKRIWGDIGE